MGGIMTTIDRSRMIRIFSVTAVFHAALALLFVALIFSDDRHLLGINIWIKPLKFALTGLIYLATLVVFARLLPDSLDEKKGNRHAWIISLTILGETLFVALQSARGVQSHFNQKSVLDGGIYSVMGIMIIINTVSFVKVMRHFFKGEQKIAGAYLAGIRWGVVVFLFGSLVGGVMSGLNRHTIGLADGGPGWPLVNFSTVAGDLRIAHFLGIHALQILPLTGWLLARIEKQNTKIGLTVFSAVYAVGLIFVFAQALFGKPLLRL
jgi:hypothetical protein